MCDHVQRIEDYSTGDEICEYCGVITSTLYGASSASPPVNNSLRYTDDDLFRYSAEKRKTKRHPLSLRVFVTPEGTRLGRAHKNFLLEITEKMHLPTNVAKESFSLASIRLPSILEKSNNHARIDARPLLALTLYDVLKERKIPRELTLICYLCETSKQAIRDIQDFFLPSMQYPPIHDYVETMCANLNLSFYIMRETYEAVSELKNLSHYRPEIVVVTVLLLIQEREKKVKYPLDPRFVNLSIQYICSTCNVARTTVNRLKKNLVGVIETNV